MGSWLGVCVIPRNSGSVRCVCRASRGRRIRRRRGRSPPWRRPGGLRGVVGAVAQRERREGVRRHGPRGDGRVGGGQASARGERAAAPRERDPDDGVGFFRGEARPDTAMMVEYIDAHRDRFGVGPICRTLGGVPGLGSSANAATGRSGAAGRAGGGRATRRWPGTSWRSIRTSSWPCTATGRCFCSIVCEVLVM